MYGQPTKSPMEAIKPSCRVAAKAYFTFLVISFNKMLKISTNIQNLYIYRNFLIEMFQKLKQNIKQIPDWQAKKYLLAFSGGVDSVVLATGLQQLGVRFILAHCNFKLRGAESDADQAFVEKFAKEKQIPLHINICDLSQTDENIQIAARNARYQWFDSLLELQQFDYLLTAHHLDDSMETFFINLLRSTGLKGLLGIKDHHKTLRPLQNITRQEILKFARQHSLTWREDSSNASDKYRRNFIRHQIIPKLVELQPDFHKSFHKTLEYLKQNQAVIDDWFENIKNKVINEDSGVSKLDIKVFDTVKQQDLFLFHWLSPRGFIDMKAVKQLLKTQTGKEIFSRTHRLTKYGNYLLLQKTEKSDNQVCFLQEHIFEISEPIHLKWNIIDRKQIDEQVIKSAKSNEIYIDYDLVDFPLKLKKWQSGDYFYPFGMKGKKKLSDYFKDIKLIPAEKEKIWLLCNRNDIVWIVGKRMDNRYKITEKTEKILHLQLVKIQNLK